MDLSSATLVYIAPRSGRSGVGDYADEFIDVVRPHVGRVVEIRTDGPGTDTVRGLRAGRRQVRGIVAEAAGPVIVHTEQSGGEMLPFWGPYGLDGVTVTSTVHDPPLAVWWPFRTRFVASRRLLSHGIHYPIKGLTARLERRVNAGRTLFALSRTGADHLRGLMTRSEVRASSLFVPERDEATPVAERPRAVGLFGYVYRGKGFDSLAELRAHLDPSIAIRVAGRGTEQLPAIDGVEVLGEVNGADEDAFFTSIRALVVPYVARRIYGVEAMPAASTVSRAIAYGTPVIARAQGSLRELEADGCAVVVDGDSADLARAANALIDDDERLAALAAGACALRTSRSAERVVDDYLAHWRSS